MNDGRIIYVLELIFLLAGNTTSRAGVRSQERHIFFYSHTSLLH